MFIIFFFYNFCFELFKTLKHSDKMDFLHVAELLQQSNMYVIRSDNFTSKEEIYRENKRAFLKIYKERTKRLNIRFQKIGNMKQQIS